MTSPDDDGYEAAEARSIAVLVRSTLAAVADTTEIIASAPPATSGRALRPVPGDTVTETGDTGTTVHLGRRAPSGASRWWLVAAAAVLLVIAGVVVTLADEPTVSTGPAGTGEPPTGEPATAADPPAVGDEVLLGPPRTIADQVVGDLELVDVQVSGWSHHDADGSPVEVSELGPVQWPFATAGSDGLAIRFTYAAPGQAADPFVPPLRVTLRTGVTMDLTARPDAETPPSIAPELFGPLVGEACPPGAAGGASQRADTSTIEAMLGGPVAGDRCRLVVVVWSANQVVVADGDLALSVDGISEGLRLETLDELEVRLAGIEDVEDIRRVLEEQARPRIPRDEPTVTDTTTEPPAPEPDAITTTPESSACSTWRVVDQHLFETGGAFDAAAAEDLVAFQAVAPPEFAADVARLVELADAEATTTERDEVIVRIRTAMVGRCGVGVGG